MHKGIFGVPQRGFSQPQRKITSTKMIRMENKHSNSNPLLMRLRAIYQTTTKQAEHKLEYERQSQFYLQSQAL